MKTKLLLNDETSLAEYELALINAQNDNLKKRLDYVINSHEKIKGHKNKLRKYLSEHLCIPLPDDNNLSGVKLPLSAWGEIMDKVYEKQNDLIRPSHYLAPYSLVQKQPDLQDYIPRGRKASALDKLHDKSTVRALEILNEYNSDNTQRAQVSDLIYWQAWLGAIEFDFNSPITEKEITTFIVQHVEGLEEAIDKKMCDQGFKNKLGAHKLSTIKRRIATLSVFLDKVKWTNPCRHNKNINSLLQKLTKKHGGSQPAGKAITKDILDDMLATCKDKLIDKRDKAMLLFAWASGGRRRSEVVDAKMKDLTKTPDGEFVYTIPKSKTDQEGKGHNVPVKGRAADALNTWLITSGVVSGPIFRAITKGSEVGWILSSNTVYRVVRKRLKLAGYNEKLYGAHSLRSGFVTEAGRRNKPLGDVMALTTHRNVNTVMKYYQAGDIINNSAANLAD